MNRRDFLATVPLAVAATAVPFKEIFPFSSSAQVQPAAKATGTAASDNHY